MPEQRDRPWRGLAHSMLSRVLWATEAIRPLVVMQAAEAELLKNKGVIINVSSVSAVSESPVPGLVPYYVAKSAQVGVHAACSGHKQCMLQQRPACQQQPGWLLLAVALHCCIALVQTASRLRLMNR